jgi:hypothetical protein
MSAVSHEHIAQPPFSRTKCAYSVTLRPFSEYGQDAIAEPFGCMMIVAVLNSGCGDGAVMGAQDVETTSQRNWPATEPGRDGAVGESEHATAATSAITHNSTRTITSVDTGGSCLRVTIQVSCQ